MAPGLKGKGDRIYASGHNLIKAHAKAYRIYEKDFKSTQKGCQFVIYNTRIVLKLLSNVHDFLILINAILSGMVGITLNTDWQVPKNPNDSKDKAASDRAINFMFGWFLNPVIGGDYPNVMKEQVDRKSKEQGFTTSRLPSFTPNEKLYIKGMFSNSVL